MYSNESTMTRASIVIILFLSAGFTRIKLEWRINEKNMPFMSFFVCVFMCVRVWGDIIQKKK